MGRQEDTRRASRFWLALLGAVLTLSGPFLWAATVGVAVFWQTGLLMWVAMVIGAALGAFAVWKDRRLRTAFPAGFSIALLIVAIPGYIFLTRIPESKSFDALAQAPRFALPNQRGDTVRLDDLLQGRAALVAFYRGYW